MDQIGIVLVHCFAILTGAVRIADLRLESFKNLTSILDGRLEKIRTCENDLDWGLKFAAMF
ncbi:hypothetical protein H5410_008289 [Solanum commersonii]|uniref:Uncharacterized protein n=1 Tax=Solanum commersonii TaxID=4109 RepID=A0A9J6AGD4_SOLCO|nr:hypothetical protein H5410_008289 [Solanum commersonii]